MDRRKFNRGTIGNKGGRKPKADEIKLIEQMDAIAVPELAWKALWAKCKEGDTQAIKTWLAYRYGQPKQNIDHTSGGEAIPPVIKVMYEGDAKALKRLYETGDSRENG